MPDVYGLCRYCGESVRRTLAQGWIHTQTGRKGCVTTVAAPLVTEPQDDSLDYGGHFGD